MPRPRDPRLGAAFQLGRRVEPAQLPAKGRNGPCARRVGRCDRRFRGRCSRHRCGGAASGGSFAAPGTACQTGTEARTWPAGRPADPGRGRVRHASSFGPGTRIATAARRRLWRRLLAGRAKCPGFGSASSAGRARRLGAGPVCGKRTGVPLILGCVARACTCSGGQFEARSERRPAGTLDRW